MAKRKRLTPARLIAGDPAPEVKAMPDRPALSARPPIADVAHDAATSAALTEVAQELHDARSQGRLIQSLPLDAVDPLYLVRDRIALDGAEMFALVDSLRDRGQQTPVEVTDLGGGRYGLISGYRRYVALQGIAEDSDAPGTILAIVRQPREASDSYRAMVEENEIRVGLSFYERGRIVARATDAGVYASDAEALLALFSNVPRARRSKIKSFVSIVRALDDVLRFPTALSEKQGLAVAKALAADKGLAGRIRQRLQAAPADTPAAEGAALLQAMTGRRAATPRAARAIPISPGLTLMRHDDGRMVLTGSRTTDEAFIARLIQTLKSLD